MITQQRSAFWLVISGFFAIGLMFGAWQVMLADMQRALALSDGELGLALTIGVLGSFPAMFFTGRLADRWGARYLIMLACTCMAISFIALHWVQSYWSFTLVAFCLLATAGAMDVGINTAAVNYEQNTKDKKMSFFHAGYSGSASVAALGTGFLLLSGMPFRHIYILMGILLLGLVAIFAAMKALDPLISHHQHAAESSNDEQTGTNTEANPIANLFRVPVIALLATIIGMTFFSEGALEVWSAVYLRLTLELPTLIGAAGPAIFHFAMMTGRLGSGWIMRFFRRRFFLRLAGVMTAVGMLLSVSTTYPPLILLGFLIAGLALAGIVPIVFSLAGDIVPKRAGGVISTMTMVGYAGFMLGPVLIGQVADVLSLRFALASLVLAGIGISLLSTGLHHPKLDSHESGNK